MPEPAPLRLRRGLLLLAAASMALAVPGGAIPADSDAAIAKGRAALTRGDGVAAEIAFAEAERAGIAHEALAAGMGEALLDQGKLDLARKWLAPESFARSDYVQGLRMVSRLEMMSGNPVAATAALERAISREGGNGDLWVDLAQLRYRTGAQFASLDAIDKALAVAPGNVRALEFRGLIVRDQFGPNTALPWFESALLKAPKSAALLGTYAATLGEAGKARAMLAITRKMIQMDTDAPRAFYLQAVLAARAGNLSLARTMLNRAGNYGKGTAAGLQLDGTLQLATGNPSLALQSLERLAALQPENEHAELLLAQALLAAGRQGDLVARYADARPIDLSPTLAMLVGRALEDLGRRSDAAPWLDAAAAPCSAGLHGAQADAAGGQPPQSREEMVAAKLRGLIVQGKTREAIAAAEGLRSELPGLSAAMVLSGDAYYADRQFGAAFERYAAATRVRTDDALLTRLVLSAAQSGKSALAAATVAGYLKANPQSRGAVRLAADYAASVGDWNRARQLLGHLRATGSGRDARLLTDLAYAQLRSGNRADAEATARTARRVQAASPLVATALARSLPDDDGARPMRDALGLQATSH